MTAILNLLNKKYFPKAKSILEYVNVILDPKKMCFLTNIKLLCELEAEV